MASIANLLIVFGGVLVLNTVLSSLLLWRYRTRLHKAVLYLWASSVLNFMVQGALYEGTELQIIVAFGFIFGPTLSLAYLLASLTGDKIPVARYIAIVLAALAISVVFERIGQPFPVAAFPLMLGIVFPAVHTLLTGPLARFASLTFAGKGLVVSTIFYILHTADYPFLRLQPEYAALGFTVGVLAIFALTIFAPAVVLQVVANKEGRRSAEMDAARQIQTQLRPMSPQVVGHQIVCYMKPSQEVGGNYYDVFNVGDTSWILVGDVSGYGLNSGLVMLMGQCILRSIVQAQPDVSPSQLHRIAHRVLAENLRRLGEPRTMSIVAFTFHKGSDEVIFSGSHRSVYLWRSDTGEVETLQVRQFPGGLGQAGEMHSLIPHEESRIIMSHGDVLFIGTDGIAKAPAAGDDPTGVYGEQRLAEFISKNAGRSVDDMRQLLIDELQSFTGGVFHEDVTFVIVKKG